MQTVTTNCSNNFGPNQHDEKLIPKIIKHGIQEKTIPIYGNGRNIRDWIFVNDHCNALLTIIEKEKSFGSTYNIGGDNEITNIALARKICDLLDRIVPIKNPKLQKRKDLIKLVDDRLGHDFRYSISSKKMNEKFNWTTGFSFDNALNRTINYYLEKFK